MKSTRAAGVLRWTRYAALVLVVTGAAGFLIQCSGPTSGSGADAQTGGFPTVALSITPGTGLRAPGRHPCVLAAKTEAQQATGLMGRKSLGGYAGMVFVFPDLTTDEFYMKSTLIPLSIAWFDRRGSFLAATTMLPCPPATAECPTYSPGQPYLTALEVPAGRLAALGIGAGSAIGLGGSCQPG